MYLNIKMKVSYGRLDQVLRRLRYTRNLTAGDELVYRNSEHGSLIIMKNANDEEIVPEYVVASTIRNIVNFNIAKEERVVKLLMNGTHDRFKPMEKA